MNYEHLVGKMVLVVDSSFIDVRILCGFLVSYNVDTPIKFIELGIGMDFINDEILLDKVISIQELVVKEGE